MKNKTYIKMCREAHEIQDKRPEWITNGPFEDFTILHDTKGNQWYVEPTSIETYVRYTWLPRQEDLQEIILNKTKDLHWCGYHLLKHFNMWLIDFLDLTSCHCSNYDLNQLWLCYVMEEFYKKWWNGITWEQINCTSL